MIRPNKEERNKYHVDYSQDTEFSAYARLLQSKWREKKGMPWVKYGNFLPAEVARKEKLNFYELFRKGVFGKLIKEDRMWENLLSSQPLCFNLFGELHFDLKLATKFFSKLFPDKIGTVTDVIFEYSPGRGNSKYIDDHSAFDVFIEYSYKGKKGFIGIEVKYAESLNEETEEKAEKNFKEKYAELTESCKLFNEKSLELLKKPPLSQIWRDHLLSVATKQDYDEGFFVFLFPSKNKQCQSGVDDYLNQLSSKNEEQTGFYPRHLELFIKTLREVHDADWTKELEERYLGI
jgi:hypothetical protein